MIDFFIDYVASKKAAPTSRTIEVAQFYKPPKQVHYIPVRPLEGSYNKTYYAMEERNYQVGDLYGYLTFHKCIRGKVEDLKTTEYVRDTYLRSIGRLEEYLESRRLLQRIVELEDSIKDGVKNAKRRLIIDRHQKRVSSAKKTFEETEYSISNDKETERSIMQFDIRESTLDCQFELSELDSKEPKYFNSYRYCPEIMDLRTMKEDYARLTQDLFPQDNPNILYFMNDVHYYLANWKPEVSGIHFITGGLFPAIPGRQYFLPFGEGAFDVEKASNDGTHTHQVITMLTSGSQTSYRHDNVLVASVDQLVDYGWYKQFRTI